VAGLAQRGEHGVEVDEPAASLEGVAFEAEGAASCRRARTRVVGSGRASARARASQRGRWPRPVEGSGSRTAPPPVVWPWRCAAPLSRALRTIRRWPCHRGRGASRRRRTSARAPGGTIGRGVLDVSWDMSDCPGDRFRPPVAGSAREMSSDSEDRSTRGSRRAVVWAVPAQSWTVVPLRHGSSSWARWVRVASRTWPRTTRGPLEITSPRARSSMAMLPRFRATRLPAAACSLGLLRTWRARGRSSRGLRWWPAGMSSRRAAWSWWWARSRRPVSRVPVATVPWPLTAKMRSIGTIGRSRCGRGGMVRATRRTAAVRAGRPSPVCAEQGMIGASARPGASSARAARTSSTPRA
jgi:hypothetical protein